MSVPAGKRRAEFQHRAPFGRITKGQLCCITAIGTLLCATSAFAQEGPQSAEDIVVTGSRVIKNGNNSPSPTTIVSSQELLTVQPGQLNDALLVLPVFAGGRGSSSNGSSTGNTTGGNGAGNVLNLRNLGAQRTLPLLDGQRIPPTMFNGNVDVDLIPQMLVQRVDVVTGGVSAVYGSDAVSGVVNYILNKTLKGIKLEASEGVSSRGDGWKTDLGAAFGTSFADGRGHFEASYEFRNERGVLYRSSRDWLRQPGITGLGTTQSPFVLIENARQSNYAFGGLITTGGGIYNGQFFKTDGVLSQFAHGAAAPGVPAIEAGGDGAYYDGSLLSPMRSHQYFGRFDFELTDNVKFYAEILGNIKTNHAYADWVRLTNVTLRSTNPFLSTPYQQAFSAAGTTFRLSEVLSNAPREDPISNVDQRIYRLGFAGNLGGFEWGVDAEYGKTKMHTILGHNLNFQKLAAALDPVVSNGQIVCRVTTTNPGVADGCIPLNPFGPTAGSAAAYDYIQDDTDWRGTTEMPDVTAHISGSPFALPAGPVNMALSGEWRKVTFSATSTSGSSTPFDCTGITFNCTNAARLYDLAISDFPKASETVWEGAYEVGAPILGHEGGWGLDVNGAARYTSYEHSGNYVTWKVGADLRLSNALRFRATRSRDIRAPNVFDLFAPPNPSNISGTDLLTGLPYTLVSRGGGGNTSLRAEKGDTFTAGFVWKPSPKFSVSLDYFHIRISDALASIDGRSTASQLQCYASGGSSPFCDLQLRANGSVADAIAAKNANPAAVLGNPAYAVTAFYGYALNVAEQESYGFDFELNFSTRLFGRPLATRVLAAYQPHIYIRQPGNDTIDNGGVGWGPDALAAGFKTSVTAFARYQLTDKIGIDLMERWHDGLKISGVATDIFAPGQGETSGWATTNLNLTYDTQMMGGKATMYFNVQNIFDRHPPIGAYTANGTRAGLRDGFPVGDSPMGRYFTVGVRIAR
ncbi:TonB-dependent receptor [Novosphingobium flavum]|uniref:TonB-dependent receptor n=1 Tax=Novosphingobium flavum TaxID=1778672 RepID=A0A7X1KMY0_9SPHN|nr:TonB-dependent receptor [Novosphingobium flavum]MBC2667121.1 TonB-dependent receptor [Novosphingobium flavum]